MINPRLEARLGFELSFELAKYLYDNLNLRCVFRYPTFSLAQFRGSVEHVRYVNAIRTLSTADKVIDRFKLASVLYRTVPSRFLGTRAIAEVDAQLRTVAGAIEQLGGAGIDQIFEEVTREYYESIVVAVDQDAKEFELMPKDQVNYERPNIFLVIVAQKELRFAREYLRSNGFDL